MRSSSRGILGSCMFSMCTKRTESGRTFRDQSILILWTFSISGLISMAKYVFCMFVRVGNGIMLLVLHMALILAAVNEEFRQQAVICALQNCSWYRSSKRPSNSTSLANPTFHGDWIKTRLRICLPFSIISLRTKREEPFSSKLGCIWKVFLGKVLEKM